MFNNLNRTNFIFPFRDAIPSIVPTFLLTNMLIRLFKRLFSHVTIHKDRIVGDVLYDLLDISISVSEDCLHLSVDTPKQPSDSHETLLPGIFEIIIIFIIY